MKPRPAAGPIPPHRDGFQIWLLRRCPAMTKGLGCMSRASCLAKACKHALQSGPAPCRCRLAQLFVSVSAFKNGSFRSARYAPGNSFQTELPALFSPAFSQAYIRTYASLCQSPKKKLYLITSSCALRALPASSKPPKRLGLKGVRRKSQELVPSQHQAESAAEVNHGQKTFRIGLGHHFAKFTSRIAARLLGVLKRSDYSYHRCPIFPL